MSCILIEEWDIITHLGPNFNGGSVKPPLILGLGYRNWYQDWCHFGLMNNLGNSPQPENKPRALVSFPGRFKATMTEIDVLIVILLWWK